MSAQFILNGLNLIFYYVDKLYTDRLKKTSFGDVNVHMFIFHIAVQKRLRIIRIVWLLLKEFVKQQKQHSTVSTPNMYEQLISIVLGKRSNT